MNSALLTGADNRTRASEISPDAGCGESSADFQSAVSQVFNLPKLQMGRRAEFPCVWAIGRFADCKSAIRQIEKLRYSARPRNLTFVLIAAGPVPRACFRIVRADVRRLKSPFKSVLSSGIRASLRRLLQ